MSLAFVAGFVALGVVIGATSGINTGLYIPACVGIAYAVLGVLVGKELVAIGGWLMLATVAAAFMPLEVRYLWMAAAGGGGLVVTGILLRRQNLQN